SLRAALAAVAQCNRLRQHELGREDPRHRDLQGTLISLIRLPRHGWGSLTSLLVKCSLKLPDGSLAGGASASDALQPGKVHAAQPRPLAHRCSRTRATKITVALLGNVVAMNRRPTTLDELCAHQLAGTIPTAPDARAFVGRYAPTLPARACHERHLP